MQSEFLKNLRASKVEKPVPLEMTFDRGNRRFLILWSDRHESIYSLEQLRKLCPCAVCREIRDKENEVRGELKVGSFTKIPLINPSIPQKIEVEEIEPVGRYAIQFRWNDGHDTGLYAFEYLRAICPCEQCSER